MARAATLTKGGAELSGMRLIIGATTLTPDQTVLRMLEVTEAAESGPLVVEALREEDEEEEEGTSTLFSSDTFLSHASGVRFSPYYTAAFSADDRSSQDVC